MSRVLIVGGGAAGMFAAVHAARRGHEVRLFEKNDRLGRKLFITGKGRCNLTNACGQEELFEAVLRNSKFLYSSFYVCTNQAVMDFFEEVGLKLKVERGNRVFPASDHSSDVIRVLAEEIKRQGAAVHLHAAVREVAQKGWTVLFLWLDGLWCGRRKERNFTEIAASSLQEACLIRPLVPQETATDGQRCWGIR